MSLIIPIDNNPASSTEEITLDLSPFRFVFTFNNRFNFWVMEIQNRDLITVIAGIKLVLNYSLSIQYVGRSLPPGELFCIDTTDNEITVFRSNIGINPESIEQPIQLIYIEEAELDTI